MPGKVYQPVGSEQPARRFLCYKCSHHRWFQGATVTSHHGLRGSEAMCTAGFCAPAPAAEGLRAHAPTCIRSSRPHEAGTLVPLSWVGGPGSGLRSHSHREAGRSCGLAVTWFSSRPRGQPWPLRRHRLPGSTMPSNISGGASALARLCPPPPPGCLSSPPVVVGLTLTVPTVGWHSQSWRQRLAWPGCRGRDRPWSRSVPGASQPRGCAGTQTQH